MCEGFTLVESRRTQCHIVMSLPCHAVPQISIEPEGLHLVQTALAPTDTEAMEMSAGSALLSLVNIVQL